MRFMLQAYPDIKWRNLTDVSEEDAMKADARYAAPAM